MFFRRKRLVFSLLAFLILVFYKYYPSAPFVSRENKLVLAENVSQQSAKEEAQVNRVVDGDTIEVLIAGQKEKVRVIGINTPETVDPRRPVQCFGKEASTYAKQILTGQRIILEADSSQADRDKYGRLLRYIWLNSGNLDFGKTMIEQGYAHEYTYELPYKYQAAYQEAEKNARDLQKGLWVDAACAKESL